MSRHSSPTLWRSAGFPACFSATAGSCAAIVGVPVPAWIAETVPASIYSSGTLGLVRAAKSRRRRLLVTPGCGPGSGAGELRPRRRVRLLVFSQCGEEEGLVDPALVDRHLEFHALHDDLAPVHSGLACQLGGRQVDRHGVFLPPLLKMAW